MLSTTRALAAASLATIRQDEHRQERLRSYLPGFVSRFFIRTAAEISNISLPFRLSELSDYAAHIKSRFWWWGFFRRDFIFRLGRTHQPVIKPPDDIF